MAVLARVDGDSNAPILDREVVVRRRDEDEPLTQPLAVLRRPARQPPRPPQDVREHARTPGRDVKHDADRRPQIRRQPPHDTRENLDATGRRANHNQVAPPVVLRVDSIPFHTGQRTLSHERAPLFRTSTPPGEQAISGEQHRLGKPGRTLDLEHPPLRRDPAGCREPVECAGRREHAMARHDDRERVLRECRADRPRGARFADRPGYLPVGGGGARSDLPGSRHRPAA